MARVHLFQQDPALLAREVRVDLPAEGEELGLVDVAAAICVGERKDLVQLRLLLRGLYI